MAFQQVMVIYTFCCGCRRVAAARTQKAIFLRILSLPRASPHARQVLAEASCRERFLACRRACIGLRYFHRNAAAVSQ